VGWDEGEQKRAERLALSNKTYQAYKKAMGCGEVEVASRAVAVPFVGAVAASLVLAESMRMQMKGIRLGSARLHLDSPDSRLVRKLGTHTGNEQPIINAMELV
jgi:hypothetical protein